MPPLTVIVDDEGLILSKDVVFADIPKLSSAITVCSLNPEDEVVQPSFINFSYIRGFQESRSVFINIDHSDVYCGTGESNNINTYILDTSPCIQEFNAHT